MAYQPYSIQGGPGIPGQEYVLTKGKGGTWGKLLKANKDQNYVKVSQTKKSPTAQDKVGGYVRGTPGSIVKSLKNTARANFGYTAVSFNQPYLTANGVPNPNFYRLFGTRQDVERELRNPLLGLDEVQLRYVLDGFVTRDNWRQHNALTAALQDFESKAEEQRQGRGDFIPLLTQLQSLDDIFTALTVEHRLRLEPRKGAALRYDQGEQGLTEMTTHLAQGGLLSLLRKVLEKPNELVVDVSDLTLGDVRGRSGHSKARSKIPPITQEIYDRLARGERPGSVKVGLLGVPDFPIVSNDDRKWNRAMDILAAVNPAYKNFWESLKNQRGRIVQNPDLFSSAAIFRMLPKARAKKTKAQAPGLTLGAPQFGGQQQTFAPQQQQTQFAPAPTQFAPQQQQQTQFATQGQQTQFAPAPQQQAQFAPATQFAPAPQQTQFAPQQQTQFAPAPTQVQFAPAPQQTQFAPQQTQFAPQQTQAVQFAPAPGSASGASVLTPRTAAQRAAATQTVVSNIPATVSNSPRAQAAAQSAPAPAVVALSAPTTPGGTRAGQFAPQQTQFAPAPQQQAQFAPSAFAPSAFAPGGQELTRLQRPGTVVPSGGAIGSPRLQQQGTLPAASALPAGLV